MPDFLDQLTSLLTGEPVAAPTNPGDAALAAKAAKLEAVNQEKRQRLQEEQNDMATLPNEAYAYKYGDAAMLRRELARRDARIQRSASTATRYYDEMAQDILPSMGRSASGLISGLVAGGIANTKHFNPLDPTGQGRMLVDVGLAASGVKPSATAELRAAFRNAAVKSVLQGSEALDQKLLHQMSGTSQAADAVLQEDLASAQAESRQRQADAIAAGGNEYLAGARRVGSDIVNGAKAYLDNPTALANEVVGQAPTLLLGTGAKAVTTTEAVTARAGLLAERQAIRQGMMGAAAPQLGREALTEVARDQLLKRNLAIGVGATEGGGAYQQAATAVMDMPLDQLNERYPDARIQERLQAGESELAIRSELADKAGTVAFAIAAPLSAVGTKLAANFELHPTQLAGKTLRARAASLASNVAGESSEEFVQGAGGALASNLGQAAAGDQQVDVLDGVGTSAGGGAAVGGFMAGAFQAPALHGLAAQAAIDTTARGAKKAYAAVAPIIADRADAVRARMENQVAPDAQARQEHVDTTESVLRESAPETTGAALDTSASMLDEHVSQLIKAGHEAANDLTTVPTVYQQLSTLRERGHELNPDQHRNLLNSLQHTGRILQNIVNQGAQLSDEERASLPEQAQNHLRAAEIMLQDPELADLVREQPSPEVQASNQKLVEEIGNTPAQDLPEHKLAEGVEISYRTPDLITPEAGEQLVLFQRQKLEQATTPQAKAEAQATLDHLALVRDTNQIVAKHKTRAQQLDEQIGVGGSGKTVSAVTQEVEGSGFNGKRSLIQFQREIVQAMGAGDQAKAVKLLAELRHFGNHFSEKAQAFDQTITEAYQSGDAKRIDKGVELPFRQLRNDGSLSTKSAFIIPSRPNLAHFINNDAHTVVNQYNRLLKAFPTSELQPLPKLGELKFPAAQAAYEQAQAANTTKPAPSKPAPDTATQAPASGQEDAERSAASSAAAVAEAPVTDTADADEAARQQILAQAQAIIAQRQAEVDAAPPVEDHSGKSLDDALDMPVEDYLKAVNAGDKQTSAQEAKGLQDELANDQEDLQDAAQRADEVLVHDGIRYARNDNFYYATDVATGEVVGQLASISTGTTSAVAPAYTGRGIGRQLAKLLIQNQPFAPAGSFSDGGQAARKSAFLELQRARDAQQETLANAGIMQQDDAPAAPTIDEQALETGKPEHEIVDVELTVADRYLGLRANAVDNVDDLTPEQQLQAKNRLVTGFKYNRNAPGLFARIQRPIERFMEAFKSLDEGQADALRELLPENLRDSTTMSESQLSALRKIMGEIVPGMVKQLNAMAQATAEGRKLDGSERTRSDGTKAKGFVEQLRNGELFNWHLEGRLGAMALRWGIGTQTGKLRVAYQQEIAEAMALTTIQWAVELAMKPAGLSDDALAKMFPNGVPPHLYAAFTTQHLARDAAAQLGNTLFQMLGLQAKDSESPTYTDGLPAALALEAIRMLDDAGWIQVNELRQDPTGKDRTTVSFITVPTEGRVAELNDQLGGEGLLNKLFTPQRYTTASVGKPIETQRPRVQGTGQKVSQQQLDAQARAQQQAHTLNLPWLRDVQSLGVLNLIKLRGWRPVDDNMNPGHRKQQDGINTSLTQAYTAALQLHNEIAAYAKEHNLKRGEVPVHYSWRTVSSMRSMINERHSGQANKDIRELISAQGETLDLTQPENLRWFQLALAQAFGEKTEKQFHAAAIGKVLAKLDGPLAPVVQAWIDMQNAGDDTRAEKGQAVVEALQAAYPDKAFSARELNAFSHYARYQRALAQQDSKPELLQQFHSQLALEADGKTDGMFNALMHFGLHKLSPYMLDQLRKGGLFIRSTVGSLNQAGEANSDLYLNVTGKLTQHLLDKALANQTSGLDPEKRQRSAVYLLSQVGEMSFEDLLRDQFKVERNLGKEPTTQMVYGSSMRSIMRGKAEAIMAQVYRDMSAALAENRPLPVRTVQALTQLTNRAKVFGKWIDVDTRNYASPALYKTFEFTTDEREALIDNLMEQVGLSLKVVLDKEMGPALETFQMLYTISNLQAIRAKKEFARLIKNRRAELIAAGELLPHEALSRAEERKLLKSIEHLLPVFDTQVGTKIDLATAEDGAEVTKTVKDGAGTKTQTVRVRNLSGGKISLPIHTADLGFPGVRAAALITQGTGDAAMMQRFAQLLSPDSTDMEGTLDVFDGLEMRLSKAAEHGRLINQASFEALQFDPLTSFENMLSNLEHMQLTDADVPMLREAFKLYGTDGEVLLQVEERLHTARNLPQVAAQIRAVKRALLDEPISHDHMATTDTPYQLNGGTVETALEDAEIVDHILARAEEHLPAQSRQATAAQDENLNEALKLQFPALARGEAATMTKTQLRALMDVVGWNLPVHSFLYQKLLPLLPDTLNIHWGKSAKLQALKTEIFGAEDAAQMGDGSEPGMMIGDQVFLSRPSQETLLHELVHVATQDLLRKFYQLGGKGLSAEQRAAALQLDKLAKEFLNLRRDFRSHRIEQDALELAQAEMQQHLNEGRPHAAVNEFLAWALTNPAVAERLKRERAPKGVMKLAQQVRDLVRKLLGLPNNAAMTSFFASTLGHFSTLVEAEQASPASPLYDQALFQRLYQDDAGTPHAIHVGNIYRRFQDMLATLPPTTSGVPAPTEKKLLDLQAEVARDQLKTVGGMRLTAAEELAFDSVHAILSSELPLDPVILHTLSQVHAQAMRGLRSDMLLANPDAATAMDRVQAGALLDLLKGKNVGKDRYSRSLVLANFVAAAQTYAPLRNALHQLAPEKGAKLEGNLDTKIRNGTTRLFDWVSDRSLGLGNAYSQEVAVDTLLRRLEEAHQAARRNELSRQAPGRVTALINQAEARIQRAASVATTKLNETWQERQARLAETPTDTSTLKGKVVAQGQRLEAISAQLFDATLQMFKSDGEPIVETAMDMHLPTPVMELLSDAVGSTTLTQDLYAQLNKVKYVVATTRQRLREEVPQQVREFFKQPLTKAEGRTLMGTVARTDLQSLLGSYGLPQLDALLRDDLRLDAAIRGELSQLSAHVAEYEQEARRLAQALVHRNIAPRYRNATALAKLLDYKAVSEQDAEQNRPILDRLVTLMALRELGMAERQATAQILARDGAGAQKLLLGMRKLVTQERNKNGAGVADFNGWKGFIPESRDPRSHVVLATPAQAKDLVKRGYRRVAGYQGDARDPGSTGMAYYAIAQAGGPSTYVQGVLQTVAPTAQGLNLETGASLDPGLGRMVVADNASAMAQLLKRTKYKDSKLSPIYDANGEIAGFERVLDPGLLDAHLRGDEDLANSVGIWMGRQMEEQLADGMNRQAVRLLHEMYQQDAFAREHYVDLASSTDPVYRDAWNSLPKSVQKMLLSTFDGKALVRKDMVRNAVGYRAASIGDVFTGLSRLPAPMRKQVEDVSLAIFGESAYRKLVMAERAWEGAVGLVKDHIIVRMGVVALGNIMSNVVQLVAHGVPVTQIPRLLARKAQETEIHMRNEKRLAQLALLLNTAATKAEAARYQHEADRLVAENQRLSIAALVGAGELPTIAEGLTEQDQYNSFDDMAKWVEKKVGALPTSMQTALKYAVISRDTAIYQGLNRFIQFGDFTAKAVVFDHLRAQGMDERTALARVSERFVNYNRNAGRTRDKLESMGLVWFWNYKVRIQKIVLSTLRENPLRFLLTSLGADALGIDSLASSSALGTNWGYSIGPGQMSRALDGGLWFQLLD